MEWNSENVYLSESELSNLPDGLKKYVAIFNDKYLLIAEPERYMNHSCDPNTETLLDGTDIAIKDMKAGDEITGDYRKTKALIGFECNCKNANCSGYLSSNKLRD